jgi:hypothetical protein
MPASPAPAHTDWLRNTLTIVGAVAEVDRFRAAAAGSGVVPWVLDLDTMEEDWFLPMAAPADGVRAISVQGARVLARRLRDAAAVNHQRALTRMLTDRSCPLDLQRLLPVPEAILRLGPDDPATRAWLWARWGTPRALRQVRERPAAGDRRRRHTGAMQVEFWSADWSPWQAMLRVERAWPTVRFELRPHYADPADG